MIPVIPWYVTVMVFVASITAGLGTWRLLARAAVRSGLPAEAVRRVRVGAGLYLGIWFVAAWVLAPAPASLVGREPGISPLIPFFAVASIVIALVALGRSASLRRAVDALSIPGTIALQAYRAIGVSFLILLALGQLPAHFAEPAGWGDIAIGLLAPLVALALASGAAPGRALAYTWNVVGLLDLAVAVGMGTGLLAPILAPQLGPSVPPAAALGVFPMILVPTYVVPLSILLHAVAIRGLRRLARTRGATVQPVAVPR